ncbi:hypothetical protein A1355_16845 [Methylomonas koyamae]|uniref:HupE/UreJ family protein n=1 Tax=Methylomonas koyamae TaxID=702114 RepID=A0A177PIF1_9GAMM|nr:hypothetical protein A1355_16845 [Methylomonas koyamae]
MFLVLISASFAASAHKASDAYLSLTWNGERWVGRWDMALRDLQEAVGLDQDDDGRITWRELRERGDAVAAHALSRLDISGDGRACRLGSEGLRVDEHSDGGYAVLDFRADCPATVRQLMVDYRWFFEFDARHRGLFSLVGPSGARSAVFSPEQPTQTFELAGKGGVWPELAAFVQEGMTHIWAGYDHLLFLLSLLLPAALARDGLTWRRKANLAEIGTDVLAVVTAFTLAHSLTLALTVWQYLALPSRWVEAAIAASVAVAALNNIYAWFTERRVWLAFGFGLIHGMGIAGVLLDLALPKSGQALALLGFNLGVELGQLAIIAVALPLIYWGSRQRYYPVWVLKYGSTGIVGLALIWLVERGLDVAILPS